MFYVKEQLNDAMEVSIETTMKMYSAAVRTAVRRCRSTLQRYLQMVMLTCLAQQSFAITAAES